MANDYNTDMTTASVDNGGRSPAAAPPGGLPHTGPVISSANRGLSTGMWLLIAAVAVVVIGVIAIGILSRASAEHHLAESTHENSTLTVNVIHPQANGVQTEIALPGNTQAFDDTPIYARTNGYLKAFYVDIGQRVTKGQLMAVIETPEVDEQLQVAQANFKSAQADLNLANTTSERYQNLLKQDSVSKQETDVAVSGALAKRAAADAAEANVRRLQQLQSFERIYAPFSGVVTIRNTDIGALIDAGSGSTQPRDLFRIAATGKLRVFVAVPEVYAPAIADGERVGLTLDEYPGQVFYGMVARNSSAIDQASRTLNVEVDVDNAEGKLLPGAYVFAHFKLPQGANTLGVPANAMLFRAEGLRVGLVQNGHVHLQPVTIGKDNGSTLTISAGLQASDQVILDPADSLAEGQPVRVSSSAPSAPVAGAAKE